MSISLAKKASLIALGLGTIALAVKYRRQIIRLLFWRKPREIVIVTSTEECQKAIEKLLKHCQRYGVVSVDCEWNRATSPATRGRNPVALLTLCSARGLCVLIRLIEVGDLKCLEDLLMDRKIVKVGLEPLQLSSYLAQDYLLPLEGTLDLRHLCDLASRSDLSARKVARITDRVRKIELSKGRGGDGEDWETPEILEEQIKQVAGNAFRTIEIFKELMETYGRKKPLEVIRPYLDVEFSWMDVDTNCYLLPSSGNGPAERCSRAKADHFVARGLGKVVKNSPLTVALNFNPRSTRPQWVKSKELQKVMTYYAQ